MQLPSFSGSLRCVGCGRKWGWEGGSAGGRGEVRVGGGSWPYKQVKENSCCVRTHDHL